MTTTFGARQYRPAQATQTAPVVPSNLPIIVKAGLSFAALIALAVVIVNTIPVQHAAPVQPAPAVTAAPVTVPEVNTAPTVTMGDIYAQRAAAADKAYRAASLNAEINSVMPREYITGDVDRDLSEWARDSED